MKINEKNYVDEAENVIRILAEEKGRNGKPVPLVTISKLRNLLSMTADIYNEVRNANTDTLGEEVCSRIEYLRVRFLYEAGREPSVKRLVEQAGMIDILKDVKGDKKKFILFSRYMEALVAFHKYYGGKDM